MDWIGPAVGTLVAQLAAAAAVWISWRRLHQKGIAPEQLNLDRIRGATSTALQDQVDVLSADNASLRRTLDLCEDRRQHLETENRDLRPQLRPRMIDTMPIEMP